MRSDRELVEAVLGGDRASFGLLVERYERAALGVALRVLGDRHAAQDAAQEAFVAAYEKLGGLRSRASFGAWMLLITHRQALRLRRRRRKAEPLTDRPDPHANGHLDGDAEQLLHAVGKLPAHERVAVTLRYYEAHSVQEIADITGCPVGTVTKRLTRAHRRLKGWLHSEDGP